MAKYIDVKIVLEKTMKIDTDDLNEAIKIAEESYPDLELTPEWLDARDVSLSENSIIGVCANRLADLSYNNFDKKLIDETLGIMFGDSEIKDYVYNEALEILRNKYHVDINDIIIQEEQFIFEEIKKEYDKKYNDELNKTGLFWAFNQEQFDKNKTNKNAPNSEYITIGDGGYLHKSDKAKFDNFFKNVAPKLKRDFISKINIDDLIKYELNNYEAYYIGDYTQVIIVIKDYYKDLSIEDITKKVKGIYKEEVNKIANNYDEGNIGIQGEYLIVQDQIKQIAEISFRAKNLKDENEKNRLDNDVKTILTNLKKQAIDSFKDESDIKKFLDNIINFNNYSFNNQCLIWLQNPNAKYVASFKTFSKMGYKINKGEVGIKILIPSFLKFVKINKEDGDFDIKPLYMLNEEELKRYKDKEDDSIIFYKDKVTNFSVGNVFDASQTDMPLDKIEEDLNPVLEDPTADGIADTFIKAIYKDGFKVKYDDINGGAKGYCDFDNNTIVVRKGLSNLMRLKVIIHEYAHSLAHKHLKDNNKEYKEHRNQYETEAESVAYVVSKYLGLDTKDYSHTYLYSWSKEKDFKEIDDSFNTIVNYSKKIISNYNKMYEENLGLYADEYKKISM